MSLDQINQKHIKIIMVYYIFGTVFITLPSALANITQHTGAIVILMALALFVPLAWLMTKVMEHGNGNIVDISLQLMGPWLGRLFSLLFLMVPLFFFCAFMNRLLIELFVTIINPQAPMEILVIMSLLVQYYLVSLGAGAIGKWSEIIVLPILVSVVVLIAMSFAKFDIHRIQPLFDAKPMELYSGTKGVLGLFAESGVLLFVWGNISSKDNQKTLQSLLWAALTGAVAFILTYWICLGNFGVEGTAGMAFPILEAFREISFSDFVEHLDSIFLVIWFFLNIAKSAISFQGLCNGFQSWFRLSDYRIVMMPVFIIVYYLSLVFQNSYEAVFTFEAFKGETFSLYAVAVFVALYGLTLLRKRGKGGDS